MSDLPADTLTTTIANVLAGHKLERVSKRDGNFVVYDNACTCGELLAWGAAVTEDHTAHVAAAVVSVLATHNEQAALRLAADELESAHRSGEEVGVSWWWLRDRADRLAAVSPTPPTHKEQA